ncbi:unnamed protein product [Rotaria sp. Silwood1]|nr:unnamed protein product [Rotaria sp. Silwood1]CAF1064889.1 unnamed protein product [Rotaria sp. Silwood1]CAF3399452.1 unnamed protein product [Rotaria sp. Silwood1]CAF3432761.1 unnamed protein product [Rotaria sp. Silwood1]CAF3823901.1 unnamed protein product [Rotaria sp. Silwood1]
MSQQHLFLMFMVGTSLFIIVQMCSINNNPDELRRYQRGFGNRRALVTALKHHYPKPILAGLDNQDHFRADKYLFSNPYDTIEQNDLTQQQQQQQIPFTDR